MGCFGLAGADFGIVLDSLTYKKMRPQELPAAFLFDEMTFLCYTFVINQKERIYHDKKACRPSAGDSI